MQQAITRESTTIPARPALRRVRKDDAKAPTWLKPDPLDYCLDCWKTWMHRTDTDLGAQTHRSLRGDGDGYGNSETMAMRRDNEIAEATDAMISSLSAAHRWAVYRKCSVTSVWRFPSLDFIAAAQEACCELEKKLRLNIATRLLFQ